MPQTHAIWELFWGLRTVNITPGLLGPFSLPLMVDKGKWHKRETKTQRALRQKEEGRESACPRVTYIS